MNSDYSDSDQYYSECVDRILTKKGYRTEDTHLWEEEVCSQSTLLPREIALSLTESGDYKTSPYNLSIKSWLIVAAIAFGAIPIALWSFFQVAAHCPPLASTLRFSHPVSDVLMFTVNSLGWIIVLCGFFVRKMFLLPPTHLIISPGRLVAIRMNQQVSKYKFPWDRSFNTGFLSQLFGGYGVLASIEWNSLVRLSVDPKQGSRGGRVLRFHTLSGKIHKVLLGDLLTQEVRSELLIALKEWASYAEIEPEAYALLEPQPETSYTELWIEALSAPPTRERILPLVPGVRLNTGKYEIINQLASGGQGTVYLAKHLDKNSGDTIVLKEYILPLGVTRETKKRAIEALENEARLLKQLNHPQIVKLLDFFIEDHRGYIAQEYVQGENLRQFVERHGALPEDQIRELAKSMCEILNYLHRQYPPLIHRDFTPDNLIIGHDGVLKLIDFNVAQQVTNVTALSVVGKRSYMPPEQFRGKPTPQSDLYALGACLYFLLTGEDPEPLSVLHPREMRSNTSESLDNIIAQCTQLSIEDRYQLAESVLADLCLKPEALLSVSP